jgi:hypothetical protein
MPMCEKRPEASRGAESQHFDDTQRNELKVFGIQTPYPWQGQAFAECDYNEGGRVLFKQLKCLTFKHPSTKGKKKNER